MRKNAIKKGKIIMKKTTIICITVIIITLLSLSVGENIYNKYIDYKLEQQQTECDFQLKKIKLEIEKVKVNNNYKIEIENSKIKSQNNSEKMEYIFDLSEHFDDVSLFTNYYCKRGK